MALLSKSKLWRVTIVLSGFALLIAIFYSEENWRGKRAWENCKRELEAKGEIVDWDKLIPPPVPDDQNFFAAPKIQEWFVRPDWHHTSFTNELTERLKNEKTGWFGENSKIKTEADAKDYLAWSDQFQSDFNLIREALKRPYARMDGDYHDSFTKPDLDLSTIRTVAQTLAQQAHCHLLLNQPEDALDELTLVHDMCRLMQSSSSNKPVTLVSAMINAAVIGLYVDIIAEGLQSHICQEPQLFALKEQLKKIELLPTFAMSFDFESADTCWILKSFFRKYPNDPSLWQDLKHYRFPWMKWVPHGWVYQNMVTTIRMNDKQCEGFDFESGIILPNQMESSQVEIRNILKHSSPYNFLVIMMDADPHFLKAWQTTAHNQTLVNEVQIACALERYRLAHGEYPETLDALAPQFIERIPHDIIGGQPLHYSRTNGGKFLLYSVGWNEKDDGGSSGTLADVKNGDWVWK
ncbi:MAG TPA: hypothetical protein VIK35_01990 [Verrucomicrobiae bacterium]